MNPNKVGYKRYYPFLYIFFISVFVSLVFWDALRLPFHNPWGVSGNLVRFRFNPSNDFLRYIIFLSLPVISIIVMYVINFRGSNALYFQRGVREHFDPSVPKVPASIIHLFTALFLLYALLFALGLPTYHSAGVLDTFHEGETLGPAISYMDGLIPYKDYIFVHGVFQDPLRSVMAFGLFGKSISAVRTLESIISVLTFILLMIFLLQVFRRNPLYVWITMFIIFNLQMKGIIDINKVLYIPILIPPRDITTFAFLLTLPVMQRFLRSGSDMEKVNRLRFGTTVFFFSFIPLAAFGYSIDRGFYLTAAFALLYVPVYLLFFHKTILRKCFLWASLSGMAAALAAFGIVLRGAFGAFMDFAFLKMPKYKELMDGFAFPIYDPKFLFVVLLIAMDVVWVVYKLLQEYQAEGRKLIPAATAFLQRYFTECTLMLLAVFFFRSALGRSDWEHIAYSSMPVYLLTLIILLKYYLHPFLSRYASRKGVLYALVGILLLSVAWKGAHVIDSSVIREKFPLQVKDEQYIPANYQSAIRYLKKNLGADESFFTMTSEASWYYFIDKPCPTRFPVVWFAMPYFYQQEIVQDLENKNVKYILYRNNHWANAIDGFSNEEKLPIVVRYIRSHYQYDSKWDDNEIWVRKK